MSDWIDPRLSAHLDAWRLSSRREPRRHARERARDAMLQALVLRSPQPRRSMFLFRPRFGHAGLIAAAATVMAAASVAAAGWNAPPGSALFVVRAARQGVMLKLPGSNDAVLHLEFAEQDLADARGLDNPVQSLADARTELTAAFAALPSDQASPLWTRYRLDEATLLREETGGETEGQSPPSSTASPRPSEDDRPSGTGAPAVDGEDSPRASPTTSGNTPSPSGWGGGDGGGDDGGKSPSGSPGPSRSPDH
jgi:hypothetical protein